MRAIPPALAARLGHGATTLCRCWALHRRDGLVLGFTDHDRDLALAGVTYAARAGLEAAEASAELGFAVGGGEVAGALTSAGITEADVAAGLYDGAGVETWLVDWAEPEARLLLDVATIGEIRRAGGAFVAELRGLMHRLDAQTGRTFRAACDADLGDARCRVGLAGPRYRATGTVQVVPEPGRLTVVLSTDLADAWFSGGRLVWERGANAGLAADVRTHRREGARVTLDLWETPPRPAVPGDSFALTAGCDKSLATCRDKFANSLNFQGFPHMPGNDFVLRSTPDAATRLDGSSLFR
ncbi:MAG: DUF2163 domain-containing protein [Methylorubrum populi]